MRWLGVVALTACASVPALEDGAADGGGGSSVRPEDVAVSSTTGAGGAPSATGSGETGGSSGDGGGAGASCDSLSLESTTWAGHPTALFVPVTHADAPSLMHLDSAAGFSILYLPEGTPWTTDAGRAQIGCEERGLDGWGVVDPGFGTSLPVVGTLGGDWLVEASTSIEDGTLVRPSPRPSWALEPLDAQLVDETLVVRVVVDDVERLLLLDTGAGLLLINGESGRPGDTEASFLDWNGDEVEAYLGTADLEMAGELSSVPVLRTPSFVGVEYAAEATGLPITGLLGLSGFDALYFDADLTELYLRPRNR